MSEGRTCKRGHPQTPENVLLYANERPRCRLCTEMSRRRAHERAKRPCPACGQPMARNATHCRQCSQRPLTERFVQFIDRTPECWVWRGALTGAGYGSFSIARSKSAYAHRVAFTLWLGPIADGYEIHHRCRNRACVRPEHLELLTKSEHRRLTREESR